MVNATFEYRAYICMMFCTLLFCIVLLLKYCTLLDRGGGGGGGRAEEVYEKEVYNIRKGEYYDDSM